MLPKISSSSFSESSFFFLFLFFLITGGDVAELSTLFPLLAALLVLVAEQPPVVAQQLVQQQLLVLAELQHSSWLYFMMISIMLSVLYGIPAYRCEEPTYILIYTQFSYRGRFFSHYAPRWENWVYTVYSPNLPHFLYIAYKNLPP